eukprot:TRINITY_DN833_c0_g3_i2.p1 TRINITY_DN833_c0_g3~~TRINITY_DN833_c0_g3_i2.p1  ORF type:complete len:176 (-),score=9.85 TRINITY_DN833_c0_g3_i2:295-798(-)
MIRRPPRSTRKESSAASDVYKRQPLDLSCASICLSVCRFCALCVCYPTHINTLTLNVFILLTLLCGLLSLPLRIHRGNSPATFSIISSCSSSYLASNKGSPEYNSTSMHPSDQMSDFSSHSTDSICYFLVITRQHLRCSVLPCVDDFGFVFVGKCGAAKINESDITA